MKSQVGTRLKAGETVQDESVVFCEIMGINLSQLSDKQRALIAPKDRAILGKAAETYSDAQKRGEARNERELQGQIVNLLRLRGIEVLWHRTDKKSHATIGWPDITFCARRLDRMVLSEFEHGQWSFTFPCVWEVKLPGGKLSSEQMALKDKLVVNGWRYRVIRSVDEAWKELADMGL